MFYRRADNLKNKALKDHNGNYQAKITLPDSVKSDLTWWINNIAHQQKHVAPKPPTLVIETDASNTGWGACIKGKNEVTGGFWSKDEAEKHINYRELLAVWLGIQSLGANTKGDHIKVFKWQHHHCSLPE